MRNKCTIPGCERYVEGHGYCRKHYDRWRSHGDPLKTKYAAPGSRIKWIRANKDHKGEECLPWPFSRDHNGYGQVTVNKRVLIASRVMCEVAHGKPPSEAHQAAHLCGNGRLGCTNPNHLVWATVGENVAHREEHGTILRGERCPASKLTKKQVLHIFRNRRRVEGKVLARKYGVHVASIYNIWNGHTWAQVTGAEPPLAARGA